MEGNPSRLIRGYDSFGNICGQKNKKISGISWSGIDMTRKPYVFHLNPEVGTNQSMKICVAKCADRNITGGDIDLRSFYRETGSSLFRYDLDADAFDFEKYYSNMSPRVVFASREKDETAGFGPGPKLPVKKQRPLLNRCVDTERIIIGNSLLNNYSKLKSMELPRKIVSDIYVSWRNISLTVLFGILISILITFTIHYLASFVSTVIMVVATLALLAATGFTWYVYFDIKYKLSRMNYLDILDDDLINEKTFLMFAILVTFITCIILFVAFLMRSRLNLMVALFDETASCLRSMPALIFQPLWTASVLILFIIFWSTVFLAISTAENETKYNETTTRFKLALPARRIIANNDGLVVFKPDVADQYAIESVKHDAPTFVKYLWWFLILMLFWTSEFILGCQQMTVASSVASWYFTRPDKKAELQSPIFNAIKTISRFHLGSIAVGSFLIVLFKIPRLILTYLEFVLKKYKESNRCVDCTLKCCHFTWYCLENFIRYVNHNAYTIIAIEGTNYCFSAKVAFQTLTSNTLRIVTINTMGDFIIFLGKTIVTGCAALFGVYIMRHDTHIHYLAVPVLFATVLTYLIAHAMLSVYEMVIDTMFLCFVEDVNKNANSQEGYYAPPGLLKFAQEDGAGLKGGQPLIAKEQNSTKATPRSSATSNGTRKATSGGYKSDPTAPPVGFVYPDLAESSH